MRDGENPRRVLAGGGQQQHGAGRDPQAESAWREPDQGRWEMNGEPQHVLYCKLDCWVAMDRALRLAEQVGLPW